MWEVSQWNYCALPTSKDHVIVRFLQRTLGIHGNSPLKDSWNHSHSWIPERNVDSREPGREQRRNASFSKRIYSIPRTAPEELAEAYRSFQGNYDCRETLELPVSYHKRAFLGRLWDPQCSAILSRHRGHENSFHIYLFELRCTLHVYLMRYDGTFIGCGCGKVKSYLYGWKPDTSLRFLHPWENLFA